MRIDFQYEAKPGVKIISQIQDGGIVWVKGYNGVGKSLAAKMLEIISGQHIFDNKTEFESLKNSLNFATVNIAVEQQKKLKVELIPGNWLFDENSRSIKQSSLGNFSVNECRVSADQFNSYFEARIIKGNESLQTWITALISNSYDYFDRLYSKLNALKEMVKTVKGELDDDLELGSIESYKKQCENLTKTRTELNKATADIGRANQIFELVVKLSNIQEDIRILEQFNLNQSNDSIAAKRKRLDHVESLINEELTFIDRINLELKKQITEKSLENETNFSLIKNTRMEIEALTKEIITLCSRVNLEISSSTIFGDDTEILSVINDLLESLRNEERKLDQEKAQLLIIEDILIAERKISHALTSETIAQDRDLELDNEVIAQGLCQSASGNIDILWNELKQMIRNREQALLEKRKESSFQDLERTKTEISSRQIILDSLNKLIKKRRLSLNRLSDLLSKIDDSEIANKTEYDSLKSQLSVESEKLRALQIERGNLSKDLFENEIQREKVKNIPPLEELQTKKVDLLSSINDIDEDLGLKNADFAKDKQSELRGVILSKQVELSRLKSEITDAQREIAKAEEKFNGKLTLIKSDPKYDFLADWLLLKRTDNSFQILDNLSKGLSAFYDNIDELSKRVNDVREFHMALRKIQVGIETGISHTDQVKRLEEIFNEHLKDFYNKDIFLTYAFEGFISIDSFDLRTNAIKLAAASGEVLTKPISTFSTGQKAFAFSIAMMTIVFHHQSENRVLILDEFGALLDLMREEVLMDQVKQRILSSGIAKKIVILLPLRERLELDLQNLKRQIASLPVGSEVLRDLEEETKLIESRLNQLRERGYYQYEQVADR